MTKISATSIPELAASDFDPRDYESDLLRLVPRSPNVCRVVTCGVRYAPNGVCGYCRGHVRKLRESQARARAVTVTAQPWDELPEVGAAGNTVDDRPDGE